MANVWLIVGLGNPGKSYTWTRHNVGFIFLDVLAQFYRLPDFQEKARYALTEGVVADTKIMMLKPLTFMNLSGPPVSEIQRFYKIPLERVVVLHDDLALNMGRIRVKQGGSAGGHRGLQSLDSSMGRDYWRVRIGIDHPGDKDMVADYVLSTFLSREKETIQALSGWVSEHFPLFLEGQPEVFASKVMQMFQALK